MQYRRKKQQGVLEILLWLLPFQESDQNIKTALPHFHCVGGNRYSGVIALTPPCPLVPFKQTMHAQIPACSEEIDGQGGVWSMCVIKTKCGKGQKIRVQLWASPKLSPGLHIQHKNQEYQKEEKLHSYFPGMFLLENSWVYKDAEFDDLSDIAISLGCYKLFPSSWCL